jgi:hypothetical protein
MEEMVCISAIKQERRYGMRLDEWLTVLDIGGDYHSNSRTYSRRKRRETSRISRDSGGF